MNIRSMAEGFKLSRKIENPLHGCFGAIDGIDVRIKKPRDEEFPREYFEQKGFYEITILAVVDSNYIMR